MKSTTHLILLACLLVSSTVHTMIHILPDGKGNGITIDSKHSFFLSTVLKNTQGYLSLKDSGITQETLELVLTCLNKNDIEHIEYVTSLNAQALFKLMHAGDILGISVILNTPIANIIGNVNNLLLSISNMSSMRTNKSIDIVRSYYWNPNGDGVSGFSCSYKPRNSALIQNLYNSLCLLEQTEALIFTIGSNPYYVASCTLNSIVKVWKIDNAGSNLCLIFSFAQDTNVEAVCFNFSGDLVIGSQNNTMLTRLRIGHFLELVDISTTLSSLQIFFLNFISCEIKEHRTFNIESQDSICKQVFKSLPETIKSPLETYIQTH